MTDDRQPTPWPRLAFAGGCLAIVVADLAQPLVLGWRPEHVGAVAGATLYAGLAAWSWRGARIPLWIGALMPLVPLSVLAGSAAGLPVPVYPHPRMLAVLVLQGLTAAAALATLRAATGSRR